jgi:GntR family transcriptional regulator/MocR family aminotransferase
MMVTTAREVPIISVDRASETPLYRQLYDGYREAILARRLRSGERLPSTRNLARELGISRIPVLRAFEQLLAEGYCESRPGAGTFVARVVADPFSKPVPSLVDDAAPRPGARGVPTALAARLEPLEAWLRESGPFHVGRVAYERFPLEIWRSLLARHMREHDPAVLLYGPTAGLPALREAIAAYLRAARAVRCEAEQIVVVNGSQQALDLVARVLIEPGSPIWMEEPSYWGARDALTSTGARLVPVPVDGEGLDVAAGIALCPQARAVYVTPSHQFPLGVTMSASRRLELLEWARASGAWVVEDDYDSEYRYESPPVSSLQGLDRDARVLYVGTFSKVLSPALRIGYLVVPHDLVSRFALVRWSTDICTPGLFQAVLADFIEEGHFVRHLRKTRQIYRERRAALVDALKNELAGVLEVEGDHAGLHLLAVLAGGEPDRPIAERAAELGLRTVPLSTCYLGDARRQGLVLGYGGTSVLEIPHAVRRLRRAILEAAARRRAGARADGMA